ncbi:MAG: ferredoxin [Pseudomonadota bacterium]
MTPSEITLQAAPHALDLLGGLHQDDSTIYLLGPNPARFWSHLSAQPEAGGPDPIDTWSRRALTDLATELGAVPRFPFGTPAQPFISWALKAGCAQSPVGLLVHPDQGLWVSFRGALVFPGHHPLPVLRDSPCQTCADTPCLTACPVQALTADGYDLPTCHGHLDDPVNDCMARGCAVRRTCPASPLRAAAQSAHHMRAFHP